MTPHLSRIAATLHLPADALTDDEDVTVLEPTVLNGPETEWMEIFRTLDEPNRAALLQIARTMITGLNLPTMNMPDFKQQTIADRKAKDRPPIAPADLPDAELLREYQKTNGEPGDPVADAPIAEIERRQLDT